MLSKSMSHQKGTDLAVEQGAQDGLAEPLLLGLALREYGRPADGGVAAQRRRVVGVDVARGRCMFGKKMVNNITGRPEL